MKKGWILVGNPENINLNNICDFGIFNYQNGKWSEISVYGEDN